MVEMPVKASTPPEPADPPPEPDDPPLLVTTGAAVVVVTVGAAFGVFEAGALAAGADAGSAITSCGSPVRSKVTDPTDATTWEMVDPVAEATYAFVAGLYKNNLAPLASFRDSMVTGTGEANVPANFVPP